MKAWKVIGLLAAMCAVSVPALAQTGTTGAIAGVARDTTGAVLPGVTVEAASPALIEKVRTAVTDAQGNYKIVDLRPGVYSVTFTLSGFAAFKREGIELTAGFTAAANADMKVGGLEETVTVTGASPVVDVQNVRTQNVLSRAVLDSLPNNKSIPAFAALTLGATVGAGNQDVGGNKGEPPIGLSIHGSRFNDSKLLFDGMTFNSLHSEGGGQMRIFLLNQTAVQETVLGTGGIIAESDTGGVQMNQVPREGGNKFSLYFNLGYSRESLQGTNLTDTIRARGLTSVNPIKQIYDAGIGIGGPIKQDRLWFFSANRWWNSGEYIPGTFFNKSTSNFRYEADPARRAYRDNPARDNAFRITWQASAKNKVTFSDNIQVSCQCFMGISPLSSPEATPHLRYGPSHLIQSTWNHPRTNRLLFEAGASFGLFETSPEPVDGVKPTDIRITEQLTGFSWGAYATSLNNGTAYGPGQRSDPYQQRLSVSYITGSHAMKVGMQSLYGRHYMNGYNNESLQYTFRSGLPVALTQWASPFDGTSKVRSLALFVQDQWTVGRFTLSGGVRYDNFVGWNPAQTRPGGRFVDAFDVPRVENVPNYKDVTPRGGIAWDVFGNGKTAVKGSFGKYLGSMGSGIAVANLKSLAIGQNATRTWTDADGDFSPDCELTNFSANGECGALSSNTFGRPIVTTAYATDMIAGWNARPNNVQMSASVQQELRPGVAVNVGYFRTSWGNFPAQLNRAVASTDFTPYCVTAPSDARLPNGGGYQVCGLYDVNPNKFGLVDNVVTQSSNFGDLNEHFNGVDVGFNARFGKGGFLAGGVSTGRTVRDTCFQNDDPQIIVNNWGGAIAGTDTSPATGPRTAGYCDVTPPFSANTQFKANAVYPMPWGVQTSFTFQNLPGIAVGANLVATNALIAPSLGRNLSSGAAGTANVALIKPQTVFEDRMNQLDIRLTKIVRVAGFKMQGMFDVYNVFNASTILSVNGTFGPAWLRPQSILGARLIKFGAQIDW